MERYETYRPADEIPDYFAYASIIDDDIGVVLKLHSPSSERLLVLEFGRVPALRRILEECSFGAFNGNWDEPGKPVSCFIVHNSKWLAQFGQAELIHHPDPVHYAFLTQDQFIEVIACHPPKVRWENAKNDSRSK